MNSRFKDFFYLKIGLNNKRGSKVLFMDFYSDVEDIETASIPILYKSFFRIKNLKLIDIA